MECYIEALQRDKYLQTASQEEMDQLLKELRAFTLASHFFWGLWSVCSASISTIPFDYWVSTALSLICSNGCIEAIYVLTSPHLPH